MLKKILIFVSIILLLWRSQQLSIAIILWMHFISLFALDLVTLVWNNQRAEYLVTTDSIPSVWYNFLIGALLPKPPSALFTFRVI